MTSSPARADPEVALAAEDALGPLGAPTPHWPGRRVAAGGVVLHVRESPPPRPGAPTVVFVHGLGGSATNGTELMAALSRRAGAVAVDLPGFGRSDPPADGDYSPDAHATTVGRFLAAYLSGPAHLVGNSLGGAVALLLADRRPELVATLTLVSPAVPDLRPRPDRLGDPLLTLAALPVVGARARAALAADPRDRLARVMRLCYADPDRVTPAAFDLAAGEAVERAALPWATDALQRSFAGLVTAWLVPPSRSLWAAAARVRVPALVVWGERDRLVSVRRARRLVATLPDARLLRLPDVGHVAQMERPGLVARAVLGLLAAAGEPGDEHPEAAAGSCGTVAG